MWKNKNAHEKFDIWYKSVKLKKKFVSIQKNLWILDQIWRNSNHHMPASETTTRKRWVCLKL